MMIQVQEKPYLTGRAFMFSIGKGEDLLQAVQHFAIITRSAAGLSAPSAP